MLFEVVSQEIKAEGTKYELLPNFGICCREQGGLKVTSFCACVRSFCSLALTIKRALLCYFYVNVFRHYTKLVCNLMVELDFTLY